MKSLLTVRHLVEYAALRALWCILRIVPPARSYAAGAAVGGLWYRLSTRRRRVANQNLLRTGIAGTPAEADRIARASFRHFTGHLLEAVRAPEVITAANWRNHVEIEGPASARALIDSQDAPLIFATAHLGCWEIAGFIAALSRPLYALARPMSNPYVQRFLTESHFRSDLTVVPKSQGFTPELIRVWKQRRAALAIVMDQHAGRNGLWLNFLGLPASVHTSPVRLQILTGIPLLFGCLIRTGPFQYRLLVGEPVCAAEATDREATTRDLAEDLTRRLETMIRRCPEQYLWMHRRWRTPPAR